MCGLTISRTKCICKCSQAAPCECICGFTKKPLIDDEEVELGVVTANGVDMIYVKRGGEEEEE